LCKAIAKFPLPVLTGIGHSTNMTVAELVAFRNAITPTELGDFLIQAFHEFAVPVKDGIKTIKTHSKNIIEHSNKSLTSELKLFKNVTSQRLSETKNRLVTASTSVKSNVKFALMRERENINISQKSIKRSAKEQFSTEKSAVVRIIDQLPKVISTRLNLHKNGIQQLEQSVKLMDPIQVLKRGYSITTINGKTISESSEIEVGDVIVTKTFDKEITSNIKSFFKRT